jgi:DnaJ domain
MTTPYELLGIHSNADDAAIKAAFRRAAKKYHPDLNEGDRNGERLRLLIAARAAALSSLRQLERKSRDLAAKAAGKERSNILAGTLAAAVGILLLPVMLRVMPQRPEPERVIRPSQTMGTLHISTKAPASREKGLDGPLVGRAGQPAQTSETPPSFDAVDADETGKLVAAGRGKAGWIIWLLSGTQALGETTSDEHGEWVLILDEPLAPGKHALSLFEIDPISKRGISGQRSITLSIASRQTRGSEPRRKVTSNKN